VDNHEDKCEMVNEMEKLKKQFIYIKDSDYKRVKQLLDNSGIQWIDAPGEADELCALLVVKKIVWACMSEDMDLFVYGCSRVLRYFSLINHNVVMYSMKGILEELGVTHSEFKEICILSGTDYNIHANTCVSGNSKKNKDITLYDTLKLFHKYKDNKDNKDNKVSFYSWLQSNTDYISDLELLEKINDMFDLTNKLDNFKNIKIINGPTNTECIHEIMREEGFIFIL
jgi:5'-3' exonuclease